MTRAKSAKACPICGAPRVEAFTPFCSKPCRDRDLLKWLGDGYAIHGPPALLDEEDGAPRPSADDLDDEA